MCHRPSPAGPLKKTRLTRERKGSLLLDSLDDVQMCPFQELPLFLHITVVRVG